MSTETALEKARALADGYVAGFNRYLKETGVDKISDPRCKGAAWVHDITALDFWRHMYVGQTVDGFFAPTTGAEPPAADHAALAHASVHRGPTEVDHSHAGRVGEPAHRLGLDLRGVFPALDHGIIVMSKIGRAHV